MPPGTRRKRKAEEIATNDLHKAHESNAIHEPDDTCDTESSSEDDVPLASLFRSRPLYRLPMTDSPDLDPSSLAYLRLLTACEYEAEEGFVYAGNLEKSVVGKAGTVWTQYEKERFFGALERCGPHDQLAIQSRVRTKTILEIAEYMEILKTSSHQLGRIPDVLNECDTQRDHFIPVAFEMSDAWIAKEEEQARILSRFFDQTALANEMRQGYRPDRKVQQLRKRDLVRAFRQARIDLGGNLDLFELTDGRRPDDVFCNTMKDDLDKACQLFDVWAMSSLAANVYSSNPYTTVITHSLSLLYTILRQHVSDIILDLFRICRHHKDQQGEHTVTRALVQKVLKKRHLLHSAANQTSRIPPHETAGTLICKRPTAKNLGTLDNDGGLAPLEPMMAEPAPPLQRDKIAAWRIPNEQSLSSDINILEVIGEEDNELLLKNLVRDELLEQCLRERDTEFEARLQEYITNPPPITSDDESVE